MPLGSTRVKAGVLEFAVQPATRYRGRKEFPHAQPDPGVWIHVMGELEGKKKELLQFCCLEKEPRYHYDPEGKNEKFLIDRTTVDDPLDWSLRVLRGEGRGDSGFSANGRASDFNHRTL